MTTLGVLVRVEPDGTLSVTPDTVTLNDEVQYVVWTFVGLPGISPEIQFLDGNPKGPFVSMDSSTQWIIGIGNRGPEAAPVREYPYRIVAGGFEATGSVRNEATRRVFAWRPLDYTDAHIHGTAVPPEWPPKTTP